MQIGDGTENKRTLTGLGLESSLHKPESKLTPRCASGWFHIVRVAEHYDQLVGKIRLGRCCT